MFFLSSRMRMGLKIGYARTGWRRRRWTFTSPAVTSTERRLPIVSLESLDDHP